MALNLMAEGDEFDVSDTALAGVTNGDPEVVYRVRRLDPKTHKKILKANTRQTFERGVGKIDKLDGQAAADDVLDYVLVGWTGVLLKGDPAPCTRELKLSGLDYPRRAAIVDLAGMNEIASAPERRAESFPATA